VDQNSVNVSVHVVGQDLLYPFEYVVGDLLTARDRFADVIWACDCARNFGWQGIASDDKIDGGMNVWHCFPFGLSWFGYRTIPD